MKAPNALSDISRAAANLALDTVFPPQSLLTGLPVTARAMEAELWGAVRFLDDPCCAICGFPFEFTISVDTVCGRCEIRKPAYSSARAAFAYDDATRKLVLDFKHGGRTAGLKVFVGHMARAGRTALAQGGVIVPVPLHPSRLLRRRYNQSAILARGLAKRTRLTFDPDILRRVKRTETQGGKTASSRRRNVSGAFAVRGRAASRIKGVNVILIDDVFTTGATLESCARALRKGGAVRVDAITLARVVKAAQIPT